MGMRDERKGKRETRVTNCPRESSRFHGNDSRRCSRPLIKLSLPTRPPVPPIKKIRQAIRAHAKRKCHSCCLHFRRVLHVEIAWERGMRGFASLLISIVPRHSISRLPSDEAPSKYTESRSKVLQRKILNCESSTWTKFGTSVA